MADIITEVVGRARKIPLPERSTPGLTEEIFGLTESAGSLDPQMRAQALTQLEERWDHVPLRKGEIGTYDLNQIIDAYDPFEADILLRSAVGIELTQGCNNFCAYCLYLKKGDPVERGIVARADLNTVGPFIEKYGNLALSENADPYHFSDPLDADITAFLRTYHDVSRENLFWREDKKRAFVITTAVAPGREPELENLLMYLAEVDGRKTQRVLYRQVRIVLSMNAANSGRINLTLASAVHRMRSQGMPEEKIRDFFDRHVIRVSRDLDSVQKQGRLIGGRDEFEVETVSCRQGTLITGDGVKGVAMVAATKFNPAGEVRWQIPPGRVSELKPVQIMPENFHDIKLLKYITNQAYPVIQDMHGRELVLDQPLENVLMHVGRDLFSLSRCFLGLATYRSDLKSATVHSMKNKIVEGISLRIDRLDSFQGQLAQLLEQPENSNRREEMEFYQQIIKVYLERARIMNKVVTLIDDPDIWSTVASNISVMRGTPEDEQKTQEIEEMTEGLIKG